MGHGIPPAKVQRAECNKITHPIRFNYHLKGQILELQDSTKYRGVDLQSSLSWKNDIDSISKKANSMLGFLRRKLRSCKEDTKANTHFTICGQIKSGVLLIIMEPTS